MRNGLMTTIVIAASSFTLAAAPVIAEAATHRTLVCNNIHHKANNGMVIGAVAGGLLGHTVAGHGDKTVGTVVGAGAGAVAGHEIAKSNAKRKCHYVYR